MRCTGQSGKPGDCLNPENYNCANGYFDRKGDCREDLDVGASLRRINEKLECCVDDSDHSPTLPNPNKPDPNPPASHWICSDWEDARCGWQAVEGLRCLLNGLVTGLLICTLGVFKIQRCVYGLCQVGGNKGSSIAASTQFQSDTGQSFSDFCPV